MTSQLRVKSKAVFPYTYTGGDQLTKNSPNLGTEQMAFEQYVDQSGNTWVTIAGTAVVGGRSPGGTTVPFAVDANGNERSAPPSALAPGTTVLVTTSLAYENSRNAKTTAGVVFGASGYNSKGSAQFILFFDYAGAGVPPDATIPVGPLITVAATSTWSVDFGAWGMPFYAGIWMTNSSTGPTKTIGSADTWFSIRYT